jgi:diketogulonate reductase-like aldo/keto reductase
LYRYCIDTAKGYGDSEEIIGEYSKIYLDKNTFNVVTKISNSTINYIDQFKDSLKKTCSSSISILAHSLKIFLDENFQKSIYEYKIKELINKFGVSVYTEKEINIIINSQKDFDTEYKPAV